MAVDYQDATVEHLNELRLARKYEELLPEAIFFDRGRWHDHTCCPDCCGCDAEWSVFLTLEEYMRGY